VLLKFGGHYFVSVPIKNLGSVIFSKGTSSERKAHQKNQTKNAHADFQSNPMCWSLFSTFVSLRAVHVTIWRRLGFRRRTSCQTWPEGYHVGIMKKQLVHFLSAAAVTVVLGGFNTTASAQTNSFFGGGHFWGKTTNLLAQTDALLSQTNAPLSQTNLHLAPANAFSVSNFVAQSATNSQLGSIATDLTNQVTTLETTLPTNSVTKGKLDGTLQSLSAGDDAGALKSAYSLTQGAKLTQEQTSAARQVGNLTSAYVVQKDFSTLDGSQGDVTNLVSSLRSGNTVSAVVPLKNIVTNPKLTDQQKQLITTVADRYVPGYQKAKNAVDAFKKLPGFGN
jgi:hypothetical protein